MGLGSVLTLENSAALAVGSFTGNLSLNGTYPFETGCTVKQRCACRDGGI